MKNIYNLFYIFIFFPLMLFGKGFIEETLVWTPKGTLPIQELEENDLVLTYNFYTKKIESEPIITIDTHHTKNLIRILLDDDDNITVDPEHSFFGDPVSPEWIKAKYINSDDSLFNKKNKFIPINQITSINHKDTLYCLTIEKNHNFFVGKNGILVFDS
jgi:intein/homing endonuclease